MPHILQIDASARPGFAGTDEHGSHSRKLTHLFVSEWQKRYPKDTLTKRDVGLNPPSFITRDWIQSAFTSAENQEPWMTKVLAESDQLIDELIVADILVIGAPLYNFGMPAALKAWVDLVVRMGRTVDYDPTTPEAPFTPLLADRPRHAIILSSRGGAGFGPGQALAHMNHLEPGLTTVLEFIGITNVHQIAVEDQEAGGELLAASVADAERQVGELVTALQAAFQVAPEPEMAC
ncbi:MAG: NAD(P)H dehydrogenase [Alteromonadaceae bacterium]|nr:NAD(P)H dehydrogenase [Alteromonadaceae bacterium]MBH86228.1 NAD(P)H dehydrogenase [Alteromonadaceae bacterium]|tara:strand:+ start:497 stop:1201 length:705 start_codon:yes stop_codon:yes gene_type:complete